MEESFFKTGGMKQLRESFTGCNHNLDKPFLKPVNLGSCSQFEFIPAFLQECYNDTVKLMPMTLNNFIEIIRKIEYNEFPTMDMNGIVNSLLHKYWRDGIERDPNIVVLDPEVIPFETAGFQSHKFGFIRQNMLPHTGQYFSDGVLSSSEKCTLHFMLSGSVDIWERGNEYAVCKFYYSHNITYDERTGFRKSSCPIEKGVISTKYFGTVSPIHILLAISPALAPMSVPLAHLIKNENSLINSKTISNKWISLIGDLSETMIIQIPLAAKVFEFGPEGNWNDTDIPTEYYMGLTEEALKKGLWQYTNAVILGTIDGLIMAEEILMWVNQRRILRLSQVLEAYYSQRYRSIPIRAHACMRTSFVDNLASKKEDIIQTLQTFSEVMSQNMPNYISNINVIKTKSVLLVDQFIKYIKSHILKPINCPDGVTQNPKFKLYISLDNSWTSYETLKFLINLGEIIEVSSRGSKVTVITSDSGKIVMDSVHSLGDLYLLWERIKIIGIPSLAKSLLTIKNDLHEKKEMPDIDENYIYTPVAIFTTMSTTLTDSELADSKNLLESIKRSNPDMIFIYLTTPELSPMYTKLISLEGLQTDKIIKAGRDDVDQLIEKLYTLGNYPVAIHPPVCQNSIKDPKSFSINGYANQGSIVSLRIHPYYFCSTNQILIEVKNSDKGNLITCVFRDENSKFKDCKEISIKDTVAFNILNPCLSRKLYENDEKWDEECLPVNIHIFGKRSLSTCTDLNCNMPDDIPFILTIRGIRCAKEYQSCNRSSAHIAKLGLVLLGFISLNILKSV